MSMNERFTERAQKVILLSQEFASSLGITMWEQNIFCWGCFRKAKA